MRVDKIVGIKDAISGVEIELQADYNEPSIYRVKMKEGVSEIVFPGRFKDIIWAADFGLGNGVERAPFKNTACGEYATFFLKQKYDAVGVGATGYFLSQFEIVYDPFPEWFYTSPGWWSPSPDRRDPIIIDSPDFQAPSGLFESCDHSYHDPVFWGSTFKIAPKVYTAEAMKQFQYFPILAGWHPFKDCPNLERIENQGIFGDRLEGLQECHLSFKKPDGYDSLAAYPSGGSPRFIKEFVQADEIHFSERFPEFSAERLENSVYPFKINKIIVNQFGGPQFPFGGIDYSNAPEMDKFYVDFNIDFAFTEDFNKNFIFGLGIFGITAPEVCKDVRGLYKVFQFSDFKEERVDVVTPDYLKDNFSYFWGEDLEEFLLENSEKYTIELIPKVCAGLERVDDYYYRKISTEKEGSYYSFQRNKIFLNDKKHVIEIQRLPATVEVVMRYAMNLYSSLIIEEDYFVPALPSGVRYIRDAYKRLFYNSIGPYQEIEPMEKEPVILLAWNRSRDNSSSSQNALWIVANADAENSGGFEPLYDSANGAVSLNEHTESYASEGIPAPKTYKELIEFVKNSDSSALYYCKIQNEIVLEKNSLNSLEFCGGFQEECFLGAAIDPRDVDALIPLNPSKSWDNYKYSLLVSLGFAGTGPVFWTGEIYQYEEETDTLITRRFFVAVSHIFTEQELEPYKINIDDVIMSGSPMTEDEDSTLSPYYGAFSSTFEGDFEAFQNENNIVLNNPGSMIGRAGGYMDFLVSEGKVGFNTRFVEKEVNDIKQYYHDFTLSYYPEGFGRTSEFIVPNDDPYAPIEFIYYHKVFWSDLKRGLDGYAFYPSTHWDNWFSPASENFYFIDPFIVSFEALRKVPAGKTYPAIYSQSQLRGVMADIESYLDAPTP